MPRARSAALAAGLALLTLTLTLLLLDSPRLDLVRDPLLRRSTAPRAPWRRHSAAARARRAHGAVAAATATATATATSAAPSRLWPFRRAAPRAPRAHPPSFYDTDRHGAIEVLWHEGRQLCRVYKLCRLRSGALQAPTWMSSHARTLHRCGLSNVTYAPPSTLRPRFGTPPHYDWLAADLPAPALPPFTRALARFYARAPRRRTAAAHRGRDSVVRECVSPFSTARTRPRRGHSRICTAQREPAIAAPAFLLNLRPTEPRAGPDFQRRLADDFARLYSAEPDFFDPASVLLTRPKACFRSVIVIPGSVPTPTENRAKFAAKDSSPVSTIIGTSDAVINSERARLVDNNDDPAGNHPSTPSAKRKQEKKERVKTSDTRKGIFAKRKKVDAKQVENKDLRKTVDRSTDRSQRPGRASGKPDSKKKKKKEIVGMPLVKNNANDGAAPPIDSAANATSGQWLNSHVQQVKGESLLSKEGGIELFTHRAVERNNWNKSAGIDPIKHIYGVCRIHKACRSPDRTIILPDWMKTYQKNLEAQCGLSNILYIPAKEFDLHFTMFQNHTDKQQQRHNGVFAKNKANHETELDLIGSREYRAQEQHFMTDFFIDGVHAFDALFNQQNGGHSVFKRKCLYRQDSRRVSREAHKNRDCVQLRTAADELNPAMLLHDKLKKTTRASKYIHEVLAMMMTSASRGKSPRIVYSSHLSASGPRNSTCFRSIVITRNAYPPGSVLQHSDRNTFFSSNNISRTSILKEPREAKKGKQSHCHVRLTIVKPSKVKRFSLRKRSEKQMLRLPSWEIKNQAEVLRKVKEMTAGTRSNLSVEVSKYAHDSTSVSEAKDIVQGSEIILSVNNPALTSIAFARPHTSVIEVQPFGYSAGPFRSFASSLQLKYSSVTAMPDEEKFRSCVEENYREDWDADVKPQHMIRAKESLLRLFRNAAQSFDGKKSQLELAKKHHQNGRLRTEQIPLERVCARSQRIQVNATYVASLIVNDAMSYCRNRARRIARPLPAATDI